MESLRQSYKTGELGPSQKKAVMTLIPKGSDSGTTKLDQMRGISLLCCDYKILTGVLASRMKKVLPSLLGEEQYGFLQGRQIFDAIGTVKNVRDYVDQNDEQGILVCADLKKAFDSVSAGYCKAAMKAYSFPDEFCRWMDICRNQFEKTVLNNGYLGRYFNIGRSVFQGDCMAPYIFITALGTLANAIKWDKQIKGVTVQPGNIEFKSVFYADDSSFLLQDKESVRFLSEKFENFKTCSGLELNKNKTVATGLGKWKHETDTIAGIQIKPQAVKLLGYWLGQDPTEEEKLNLWDKLPKIKRTLGPWFGAGLSMRGRSLIASTLAISQLIFPLSVTIACEKFKKEVDKILLDFFWQHKSPKLKREVLIQDYDNAGIKFPCIYSIYTSLKVKCLKRLADNTERKWAVFFHREADQDGGIEKIMQSNYRADRLNGNYSDFYRDALNEYSKVSEYNFNPCELGIKNQTLLLNQWVHVKKQSIYIENLHNADHFSDWWDPDIDKIKTLDEINDMITEPISKETYSLIKKAIPRKWINFAKHVSWNFIQNSPPIVQAHEAKQKRIRKQSKQPPAAIAYWQRHLQGNTDWLPVDFNGLIKQLKIHKNPKVYNNQYKLIHNLIITNEKLVRFKIQESDECPVCRVTEDIHHSIIACGRSDNCWQAFEKWIKEAGFGFSYQFNEIEKMLGIEVSDPWLQKIEMLAAMVRYYLVLNRKDNKITTSPEGLKLFLRYNLTIQMLSMPKSKQNEFKADFTYFLK